MAAVTASDLEEDKLSTSQRVDKELAAIINYMYKYTKARKMRSRVEESH